MDDDLLAVFDHARRVILLNSNACWDELIEAYERELRRNVLEPDGQATACPVIPLQRESHQDVG